MMSDTCRIKVICRVRPLNTKELANGSSNVVHFPTTTTVGLANRMYTYDHVFQPASTQCDVYSISAKPLVQDVLGGYNATIFAYGQTSSGKTHTMEGVLNNPETEGIIPRIVTDIFEHIYSMDASLEIHIKVSYFEIYMERVRDLLDVTKVNLPIGETKNRVPYVKGVTERFVTTPDEVLAVVEDGKANRHVSVTNMNDHSSRSHAVFLISIKQENKETRKTLTGKLYLVDLAGSEKVDKTNAQGLTLDEAKKINTSLLSLSNVISSLADGNRAFIPYRDSKLTRVLQESLGGNARTTLIICCSPSSFNEAETKTTLMFGDRAKTIKNKVAVNVELTAEEWKRRFEKQREANQKLKLMIERYEAELSKWRTGEAVPESEQSSLKLLEAGPVQTEDTISLSTQSLNRGSRDSSPAPTTADVRLYNEERAKLGHQLDEKEEELQSQTALVENLTLQQQELEESLQTSQLECTELKKQIAIIEQELVNSQDEVQEVMMALEELAVSYDSKDREIEAAYNVKQIYQDEMEKMQSVMDEKSRELSHVVDSSQSERRRNHERITSLFRDLNDVCSVLGSKSEERLRVVESSSELSEEDFTKARIRLSTLHCEARTLKEQRDILERTEREARERAESLLKELSGFRIKISQFETQNESLAATLRESELTKTELEETLQSLNEELLALKTREQVLLSSEMDREQEQAGMVHFAKDMKRALESQFHQHMESHTHQMEALKSEISAKEDHISQINMQYQEQLVEVESLQNELEGARQQYEDEKQHYTKIKMQVKVKEKIRKDVGGLTNTVSNELDRLNQLRQVYLNRVTSRIKSKSVDEEVMTPDRREVLFLEKNLEELSRAHKKTISENAEMQREIPRLHSVLASKSKRIGELEHMLRETKEVANQEYERLKAENDKIRQNFMSRLKEKEREIQYVGVVKRQGPNIVRPVPRKASEIGSSREALLAGAGVTVIGQRRRPHQLEADVDQGSGSAGGSTS